MILYTHIFDFLMKLLAVFMFIGISLVIKSLGSVAAISVLVSILITLPVYWFVLRPISSWLYAKFLLKSKLNFSQARQSSILFSPILNMSKWYPMKDIKKLPESERASAIVNKSNELSLYYAERSNEWKSKNITWRVLRVFLWILMLLVIPLSYKSSIFPFSWMAEIQASIFNGSYYPVINLIICLIPLAIIIGRLEKFLKIRPIDPNRKNS